MSSRTEAMEQRSDDYVGHCRLVRIVLHRIVVVDGVEESSEVLLKGC